MMQSIRPIVIIDDSKAIIMKSQNYIQKFDYSEIHVYENGKDGVKGCRKLFSENKKSLILLDMRLSDFDEDAVVMKLVKEKINL